MILKGRETDFSSQLTARPPLKLLIICKMRNYHYNVGQNDVWKSEIDYSFIEKWV